jgi:hypothetical protein
MPYSGSCNIELVLDHLGPNTSPRKRYTCHLIIQSRLTVILIEKKLNMLRLINWEETQTYTGISYKKYMKPCPNKCLKIMHPRVRARIHCRKLMRSKMDVQKKKTMTKTFKHTPLLPMASKKKHICIKLIKCFPKHRWLAKDKSSNL